MTGSTPPMPFKIWLIRDEAADYFCIEEEVLDSPGKDRRAVIARRLAIFLCCEMTWQSFYRVGQHFRTDVTGVKRARLWVAERQADDPVFAAGLRTLRSLCALALRKMDESPTERIG